MTAASRGPVTTRWRSEASSPPGSWCNTHGAPDTQVGRAVAGAGGEPDDRTESHPSPIELAAAGRPVARGTETATRTASRVHVGRTNRDIESLRGASGTGGGTRRRRAD